MKPENRLNQPAAAEPNHLVTLQQVEKRRHPQLPVSVGAETVDLNRRTSVTGRATDLGVGGCFVDTMNPFPEGTQVGVRFTWEGRRFHCRALVTRVVTGRGMSLAFTEADPDEEASVLEWVSELGGLPS